MIARTVDLLVRGLTAGGRLVEVSSADGLPMRSR